jgi:hypothetical protein
MEVLADPRFSTMLSCLALAVFAITLNGHLLRDFGQALFGFLGLFWLAVAIAVFLVFGWKIGLMCVAGSYLMGLVTSPVSGLIAHLLRGVYSRH